MLLVPLGTQSAFAGFCLLDSDCDSGKECLSGICVDLPDPPDLCAGVDCDTGNFCTFSTCVAGVCTPPIQTNVGQLCGDSPGGCFSPEICSATGKCLPSVAIPLLPCNDGNECTSVDLCDDDGVCQGTIPESGTSCGNSGNQCRLGDFCDNGSCTPGSSFPLSTSCERDGDLCTIDHCDGAGSCVALSSVDCVAGDGVCEAGEECNSATGSCEDLPDPLLSTPCELDGDLCTVDHCDGEGSCVFLSLVDEPMCEPVGGEIIQIDTTSVLLGATQTAVSWTIPIIVSAAGIAIVIARKFSNYQPI